MKLNFDQTQTAYISESQSARAWTERWVADQVFCPSCGRANISQFEVNRPVADFFCLSCNEECELKSQKSGFGARVLDGAFRSMCARLIESNNPNLFLLNYDRHQLRVTNLFVVPKQFFVREIIEERKPLAQTARRAGWVGCNILLNHIPELGKIFIVRNGQPVPKDLMEQNAFPAQGRNRSTRLANRSDEMRRNDRSKRIQPRECLCLRTALK